MNAAAARHTDEWAAAARGRAGGILALILFAAALVLGGGGSPAPLPELVLEWLALAVFTAWLLLPATAAQWRLVPRAAWAVAALALAVPLVQLIPLPPALWHALPGREAEIEALALIGRADTWRPWTMTPERTLASLLSLLPPLTMLILSATLDGRQHGRLLAALLGIGVISLGLGAVQLGAPADSPVQLYGVAMPNLRGFQANHNATADILLAAMLAGYALIRLGAQRRVVPGTAGAVLGLAALVTALFGFGVVFTASRMGIALLPVALAAGLWLLRGWLPRLGRRSVIGAVAAALVLTAGGAVLVRTNPALGAIAQRFSFAQDLRYDLWRDGLYVARKHYPMGAGMGGFVPALVVEERLEVVRPAMPNRAHNEYIELAVEAGLPGLAAWGAIIFLVAAAARAARRSPSRSVHAVTGFAAAVLVILLLHSMVDYPFRSMSLAVLGALCAGQLLGWSRLLPAGSFEKDHT